MAMSRLGYIAWKREATPWIALKPNNFLRFKDGDLKYSQEVIENNPIQNNRWNALNAVPWKVATDWTYNVDLDFNEAIHFISAGMWWMTSSDISSAEDGSVHRHTITVANSLPSWTLEQLKGDWTDTSNHRQWYELIRWYGVYVDNFKISASDSIVNMEVWLKALWVFTSAFLLSNATAWSSVNLLLDKVEWLTTDDSVNIYDRTPQSEVDEIASISTTNKTIQIATLGNSYTKANDAKVELIPQTPSYWTPAEVAAFMQVSFFFWNDLTAAASATESNIEDRTLEYMNGLEERFWSLRDSPSVISPKWGSAKLKFTQYFESIAARDAFKQIKKQACIMTLNNNKVISATDTNNAKYQIKFEISDLKYTMYDMPTGTDELYAVAVEAASFYDWDDGRAIRCIAENAKAWTVYTA